MRHGTRGASDSILSIRSYEHWTDLQSKKNAEEKAKAKDNPMGGIMDMMKVATMYTVCLPCCVESIECSRCICSRSPFCS